MKLDKEVQRALEGAPDESDILPMMECEGKGKGKETLQQRLWRLADDDMDVDEDGRIPDNKPGLSTSVEERHLKRKWQVIYCIGRFQLALITQSMQVVELAGLTGLTKTATAFGIVWGGGLCVVDI